MASGTISVVKRVLVVTWALGTATGVLLGLFGVQLVSSRFSTAGVSPLSRPEVLRALQAARSVPGPDESALPATPDTTAPPPSPPVDVDPARPSAGLTSSPAPTSPASTLPRPGAEAGTFVDAAAPPASTTSTAPPPSEPATTTTTAKPDKSKSKDDSKSKNDKKPTTTTTAPKKATTTTTPPAQSSRPASSPQTTADTRTISSAGGVVAVRYSGGNVTLKWARPNPGYEVYVRSSGPDMVVVYFYKKGSGSQVRAYYRSNSPSSDVVNCSGSYPNIRCS